jgi:hypothetical protein
MLFKNGQEVPKHKKKPEVGSLWNSADILDQNLVAA